MACGDFTIPSSVTSFSSESLKNCVSVSLPDGLQIIDTNMFLGCSQLESIKIPKSVVTIKEGVFNDCSNLKTVVFEDGPDIITFEVSYPTDYSKPVWFSTCPLDSIYIGRNIKYDFTPQGYGTRSLSPFREKQTLRKVVFGNDVIIIPSAMFDGCDNLISVETPEKMDSIGSFVFNGCESLSSFTMPHGIKTIGNSAFYGCKSLSSISIPETVVTIKEKAFYYCEGLTSIVIPSSVRNIERMAFGMCTNMSELEFQDGESSLTIRDEGDLFPTFSQCPINSIYLGRNIINDSPNYIYSSLGSITTPFDLTISKYVTELSGGTFANCKKINKLRFEEGADTLILINDHNAYSAIMPFSGTPIDSIYLARVIVGTDKYYPRNSITPFANVDSTFTLRIGDNLSEIEKRTYAGWRISSLIISNAVSKIGVNVFSNCNYLNTVTIEDGTTPLEFLDGSNFSGCQLESLYLGRKISYDTENSPFKQNKEALVSLTIGDQVTEIGENQFVGLSSITNIDFPSGLKKIGKHAFYGCEALTSVSIPNSVTEIGEDAFDLTRSLKSFTIEDGGEVLSINNNFLNSPLSEIYVGRNISYPDGYSPFSMLESLSKLTIGSQVTSIGKGQYAGCQNLKDVVSYAVDVPATGTNVFTESYLPPATLHVLASSANAYKATYPWSMFGTLALINENGEEEYIIRGDVTDDGIVNAADIDEVVNYIMGLSNQLDVNAADVNGDGVVNAADIVALVKLIMGNK